MTDRREFAREPEPSQQDVDDLIFWGQTDPRISQR